MSIENEELKECHKCLIKNETVKFVEYKDSIEVFRCINCIEQCHECYKCNDLFRIDDVESVEYNPELTIYVCYRCLDSVLIYDIRQTKYKQRKRIYFEPNDKLPFSVTEIEFDYTNQKDRDDVYLRKYTCGLLEIMKELTKSDNYVDLILHTNRELIKYIE